jgi:hypothetical protein
MTTELQNYYYKQPEPIQGCLLALRDIILDIDKQISHRRKYQIPFFYYKEKSLGFLWVVRKKIMVGFVTDKSVLTHEPGHRHKNKMETMLLAPDEDIPVKIITNKFIQLIELYDSIQ